MRSRFAAGPVLAILAVIAARSGALAPGETHAAFDLNGDFDAKIEGSDGALYLGLMTFETDDAGLVTGTMSVHSPVTVEGTIDGRLAGAQLNFTMTFVVIDTGCPGVATGSAVVDDGGSSAAGDMDITDECGGAPPSATFSITAKEE